MLKKLKTTPRQARLYLFFAVLFIVAPTLLTKFFPSHEGRLLVSAGAFSDPNFTHAVVYMLSHNAYGAMGFVLNNPLAGNDLQKAKQNFPAFTQFYNGGPVREGVLYHLLVPHAGGAGFQVIDPYLMMEKYPEQYNALIADKDKLPEIRVMQGYAGWGFMQLNREILRGFWNVIEFDPEVVFDGEIGKMWPEALETVLETKKLSDQRL